MNSSIVLVSQLNPGDKFRQFGGWIVYSATAVADGKGGIYINNTHAGKIETLPTSTPVIVLESKPSP